MYYNWEKQDSNLFLGRKTSYKLFLEKEEKISITIARYIVKICESLFSHV